MKKLQRWTDTTWCDIKAKRDDAIALIPCGSVEQHGPHLPTGTDLYISMGIADHLASCSVADRLLMLPPIYHTYAKESDGWCGTLNLEGTTLTMVVRDIVKGLFRQGIKHIVLFNGHMESYAFIMEGLQLAVEGSDDVRVLSINWWDFISDSLIDEIFGDKWPGWVAEHAALTETSLMLYLYPELVRTELADAGVIPEQIPYKIFPQQQSLLPPSGMFARAEGASAQIGEILTKEVIKKLEAAIKTNF